MPKACRMCTLHGTLWPKVVLVANVREGTAGGLARLLQALASLCVAAQNSSWQLQLGPRCSAAAARSAEQMRSRRAAPTGR